MIELSLRNAKYIQYDKLKKKEKIREKSSQKRIVEQLQKDLNLKQKPTHIECFDNSNFQGTNVKAVLFLKTENHQRKTIDILILKL